MNNSIFRILICILLLGGLAVVFYFWQNQVAQNRSSESGARGAAGAVDRKQVSVFINNRSSNLALGEKLAAILHERGYITSLAASSPDTTGSAQKSSEIVVDDVNLPEAKQLQSDLGAGMIVHSNAGGFLSSLTLNAGDDINLGELPLLQKPAK